MESTRSNGRRRWTVVSSFSFLLFVRLEPSHCLLPRALTHRRLPCPFVVLPCPSFVLPFPFSLCFVNCYRCFVQSSLRAICFSTTFTRRRAYSTPRKSHRQTHLDHWWLRPEPLCKLAIEVANENRQRMRLNMIEFHRLIHGSFDSYNAYKHTDIFDEAQGRLSVHCKEGMRVVSSRFSSSQTQMLFPRRPRFPKSASSWRANILSSMSSKTALCSLTC